MFPAINKLNLIKKIIDFFFIGQFMGSFNNVIKITYRKS